MTPEQQLNKRIERTLKRNQAAIRRASTRTERLNQAAERSTPDADKALRQLREGVAN
jgi:predicted DNA-binding protein (UPF0278 family)